MSLSVPYPGVSDHNINHISRSFCFCLMSSDAKSILGRFPDKSTLPYMVSNPLTHPHQHVSDLAPWSFTQKPIFTHWAKLPHLHAPLQHNTRAWDGGFEVNTERNTFERNTKKTVEPHSRGTLRPNLIAAGSLWGYFPTEWEESDRFK